MIDTITAIAKCRRCLNNWNCDIWRVIKFHEPIEHCDLGNIFKAGIEECSIFRVTIDEEDE